MECYVMCAMTQKLLEAECSFSTRVDVTGLELIRLVAIFSISIFYTKNKIFSHISISTSPVYTRERQNWINWNKYVVTDVFWLLQEAIFVRKWKFCGELFSFCTNQRSNWGTFLRMRPCGHVSTELTSWFTTSAFFCLSCFFQSCKFCFVGCLTLLLGSTLVHIIF